MSAINVLRSIDARLSRIERRSLRNVQIASVLDSVRQIASLAEELVSKARCLSEGSRCSSGDGSKLCMTGCGGLSLLESEEGTMVYKYGNGSFSIRATPGEIMAATKDLAVTIKPAEVIVKMPSSEGSHVEVVRLDEEEGLLRKGYTVKLVTRKLSTHLVRSLQAVYQCIQARRLQC